MTVTLVYHIYVVGNSHQKTSESNRILVAFYWDKFPLFIYLEFILIKLMRYNNVISFQKNRNLFKDFKVELLWRSYFLRNTDDLMHQIMCTASRLWKHQASGFCIRDIILLILDSQSILMTTLFQPPVTELVGDKFGIVKQQRHLNISLIKLWAVSVHLEEDFIFILVYL